MNGLKPAREGGIFLDVLLVFGPSGGANRAKRPAGQCGLEQVGGVSGASGAASADQGVNFINEQHDGRSAGLHFIDHAAKPLLELAFHAGAGL